MLSSFNSILLLADLNWLSSHILSYIYNLSKISLGFILKVGLLALLWNKNEMIIIDKYK